MSNIRDVTDEEELKTYPKWARNGLRTGRLTTVTFSGKEPFTLFPHMNCDRCGRQIYGESANKLCRKCLDALKIPIKTDIPAFCETAKKLLEWHFRCLRCGEKFGTNNEYDKFCLHCSAVKETMKDENIKQQLRCTKCGNIVSSLNKYKPYCSPSCVAASTEEKEVLPSVDQMRHSVIGAIKADDGKNPLDLLPTVALESVGLVLEHGARKYAAHNWRKGMKYSRLISALLRHVFAFMRGENTDPESNLPHMAHAACCVLFLLDYQLTSVGEDDRYNPVALVNPFV